MGEGDEVVGEEVEGVVGFVVADVDEACRQTWKQVVRDVLLERLALLVEYLLLLLFDFLETLVELVVDLRWSSL